jgi:hypothetical protein
MNWNPLTWGGENGGAWLVALVIAMAVVLIIGAWSERRLNEIHRQRDDLRKPYDREKDW